MMMIIMLNNVDNSDDADDETKCSLRHRTDYTYNCFDMHFAFVVQRIKGSRNASVHQ